ncbi:flagellar hook-associated protein 2 [Sporosarcina aquimarina]|uniref:flagellar hook-associated protein 2 n=1 Tax=Sporosarcina aquimarina TaxID=114975 RepID=UPI001C8ECBD7|nr:flagellar hook-associated protein 2 [Sporosarcina aquimarina]MBY0221745.1 flagellar hook-associated protein 2 [Sporosarcina aquimarina]
MRIGGLASGMDTETIIRDMMKAHRIPLDKITQKKAYTQWQMDDYRSVNRDLRKQSDKLFDTVIKEGNYLQKNVNVSDDKAVSIKSLNASSDFSGTLEVKQLAKQATLQGGALKSPDGTKLTDEQIKELTLADLGGSDGEIKIGVPNGKSVQIEFEASDTIDSVLKKINKEGNVNAFYDSFTGKISVTAKESGEGNIKIEDIKGSIGSSLKLTNAVSPSSDPNFKPLDSTAIATAGENAKFTFNGLETERASNTFQINGFEVTLKQKTDAPITFSSSADSDKIVDSVVQFVNDYNEMIEKLNSTIREKKYRDFPPLSDEQKKDMKEKEIELWEEKAKSGTLRNDPAISSMLTKLRSIMTTSIKMKDENGNEIQMSLKDLGITPSTSYSDNGKLIIKEDTLREKIAENPNLVYNLIGREDGDNSGIARQYRQVLTDTQKTIEEKAGRTTAVNDTFALGRSLKSFDKQIERFEDKLKMMENRYWKQFSAMERAIQRANAQSAQLMNAFGGGM